MKKALIALGGNIGDVAKTFAMACGYIANLSGTEIIRKSGLYETPPWGYAHQPSFLNACILVTTQLPPATLLQALLDIELKHGRDRKTAQRNGPRPLDLDLLWVEDVRLSGAFLTLPHPGLFQRAFVLVPLLDVFPEFEISGMKAQEALIKLDRSQIVKSTITF